MIDIRHLGAAPLRSLAPRPAVTTNRGARPAMEVTLSRKIAKSQTRGRKLHLTEAKTRVGRARKTRADLEQELKAYRREIALVRVRLAEAAMQQTATSEMLRLISNSPIQSVLDAVAEHAARLCDASNARIWRLEDNLLRLVASYGESPATMDGREGLPTDRDTVTGRAACDRRTIHVHDIAAEVSEYPLGSRLVKGQGWRTTLATPLLREGTPIGTILVRRTEVLPFHDQQIALLETFAGQAAIAIENARLFEDEKQRSLALARANEAIQESEYRHRQIIDTVPSLLWSAGPDGEPTYVNQRILDYTGTRQEDFRHRGWEAFLHPDDLPETAQAFYQAVQTGTSHEAVHRIRRSDGEYLWHHTRAEPLRDQQGRIVQWYGVSVDIDERKRAEERLRRSETYLAEAQRLSHSGVSAYNETAILYGSEETYRIWGFDPEQDVPSREAVFRRIHPDDRDRLNAEVQRAVIEKRGYSAAYRIVLPDGTIKYLETIGRPAFSASGELVEIVTTQIDVTERKRAEEALRESEAKFSDYAATASDWLWEIDPDYKFTLLTENAFHSNPADRIGTFCWDHALDLESEPDKWWLVRASLDSRKPFHNFVYCSTDGSGSPMYVKASGKPVFDADGKFRGYRGTGTDVTAIIRAERAEASLRIVEAEARESEQRYREAQLELAHANRVSTMGQLTSSIAHEVNQPITAAVTYALAARRWLSAEPPNFREADDALSLIVKEGNRAGEVVGRIRALIKKAPARKDAVEINDAVLEVIALTRAEAANNSVLVRTQLAESLPSVNGDRVQLQQVLLNLIINAIEAMRDVGEKERELLISSCNEPDGVSVEVRDSGPGFAPAALERVFEAFYTTKPGGLGLGLSICRSIIEAHNGRLWASPNVPRGAVFGFIAPAHPAAAS